MSGMKVRNLAIVTALLAGAAFYAVGTRRSGAELPEAGPAIPGLKQHINDVTTLNILRSTGGVTLARTGSGENAAWTVPAKEGFPADIERIRTMLIQLANLELAEPKTTNAEFYPKLGVQDVAVLPKDSTEDAKKQAPPGALVELQDASGKTIGSLIIGNASQLGSATLDRPMESGQFVRRPGSTQSWLTRGTVYLDATPMNWIDRKVMGVARERVKNATVRRAVGTGPVSPGAIGGPDLAVVRKDKDTPAFEAIGVPEGAVLKPNESFDHPVQVAAYLGMEDVMKDPGGVIGNPDPAATGPGAAHPTVTTFETFDGLVLTIKTGFRDDKWWAQVQADGRPSDSPDKAIEIANEAAAINKRTSGWLFAISQFDAKRLSSRLDEMVTPPAVEGAPPAIGPAADPPAPETGTPLPPRTDGAGFPTPNQ